MEPDEKQILLLTMYDNVNTIKDDVNTIKIIAAIQEVNLKEHIRRTEINEKKLEIFESRIEKPLDAFKFIAFFLKTIIPAIVAISTLAGIYYKYFYGTGP